jgi:hypothetical protein
VFRLNSRFVPGGEELFESFVPKSLDRHAYQCNLRGYSLQLASHISPHTSRKLRRERNTKSVESAHVRSFSTHQARSSKADETNSI